MKDIFCAKLYGIIDLGYVKPDDISVRTAQLIDGGVDVLQLRAKDQPLDSILQWAQVIKPLCQSAGVPFIVNDYPKVAAEVGADGVHIGQDDGTLLDARRVVGDKMLIGRSTHSVEQAEAALEDGFDYIGFGPIFPTPTKAGRPSIGLEDIGQVADTVGTQIPVFCIGGIKPENLSDVIASGAECVVVVSALLCADDPAQATRSVKAML